MRFKTDEVEIEERECVAYIARTHLYYKCKGGECYCIPSNVAAKGSDCPFKAALDFDENLKTDEKYGSVEKKFYKGDKLTIVF